MRTALVLVVGVTALAVACRPRLTAPKDVTLDVVELSVSFPNREGATLAFSLDCPIDSGAQVSSLTWELWLASHRSAAGLENAPVITMGSGVARIAVETPLRFRTQGTVPGPSFVAVAVSGEVVLRKNGVEERRRFFGRRDVLAHDAPLFHRGSTERGR